MSLSDIVSNRPEILEASEIVGEYEFVVEGVEPNLKVKVYESYSGDFTGIANLAVQGESAGSPYRSIHPQASKEAAVNDAVQGFFAFFSENAIVTVVEDW